ncbi:hypothetical protein KRMM14A1259_45830 [Krasilnikovia sp. MM14-A1259]
MPWNLQPILVYASAGASDVATSPALAEAITAPLSSITEERRVMDFHHDDILNLHCDCHAGAACFDAAKFETFENGDG